MSPGPASASDDHALGEAARWFARLQSGAVTAEDERAWSAWCEADPAHARAWARVEAVRARFSRVPGSIAAPALLNREQIGRRTVLRSVAGLVFLGATAAVSYRSSPLAGWTADRRTGVGGRHDEHLADGSRLILDTDTALDIRYDDAARRLVLREGAILVQTAADGAGRPFIVQTLHGELRALGTRFAVRLEETHTVLSVLEHAVEVRPIKQPD